MERCDGSGTAYVLIRGSIGAVCERQVCVSVSVANCGWVWVHWVIDVCVCGDCGDVSMWICLLSTCGWVFGDIKRWV